MSSLLKESFLRHVVLFVSSFGFELLKETVSYCYLFLYWMCTAGWQLSELEHVGWSGWFPTLPCRWFHDARVPIEGNGKYFLSILRKCWNWCNFQCRWGGLSSSCVQIEARAHVQPPLWVSLQSIQNRMLQAWGGEEPCAEGEGQSIT